MEIELVWLDAEKAVVKTLPVGGTYRFDEIFKSLPNDLQTTLGHLQACRFGKKLHASTEISPGDQIAWLPDVQVDPQAARFARVEKQRKERWRLKSAPKVSPSN